MLAARFIVPLGLGLTLVSRLFASDLELALGSTFDRGEQDKSRVYTLAYVTRGRLPDEWVYGHIDGTGDASFANQGRSINYLAYGKRVRYRWLFVGLGVVLNDHTSSRLSTNFNFKTQGGLRMGPLIGKVEHLSNGGLHGENDGDSFFSVGICLPFP